MYTVISLLISAIYTWGLGLLPAYLIRYKFLKRPLQKRYALPIAFTVGLAHLFLSVVIREVSGTGGRPSSALGLVAFVSFWLLIKEDKDKNE